MVHEIGHHLGMSHTHDGYDSEDDIDYGSADEFFYAWVGDEVNSVMGYLFFTSEFGQFDRDNMNRYLAATYLNQANQVLARIAGSPRAGQVAGALASADAAAAAALTAYDAMAYGDAAAGAKSAYTQVLSAAAAIRVQIEPQAWQADAKAKGISTKFVDRVPYERLIAR